MANEPGKPAGEIALRNPRAGHSVVPLSQLVLECSDALFLEYSESQVRSFFDPPGATEAIRRSFSIAP